MTKADDIDEALVLDETGLETGIFASFHLKSAYAPILRREGRHLAPFAVEGSIVALLEGHEPVPPGLFDYAIRADRSFVDRLATTLHVRNFAQLDAPWLELVIRADGLARCFASGTDPLPRLAAEVRLAGLAADRVVCSIGETVVETLDDFIALDTCVRGTGMRLAIHDFGEGPTTIERIYALKPEMVKLDGRWFRHLAAAPEGERLLYGLVSGLRELGTRVVAEGIETPGQLETALNAGVDCFQGPYVGRPIRAGTIANFEPLAIQRLMSETARIIPFRRTA